MAYQDCGGMLSYFTPNIPVATTTSGVLREIDIGAASADHGEYVCTKSCVVRLLKFAVTGETAGGSGTAPTVIFKKRPTPLSATGETTVGTLTIPDTTAVGIVVYKTVDVIFEVGDSLEISHTIGITGPTGMGHASVECFDKYEDPLNNSDMLLSTT